MTRLITYLLFPAIGFITYCTGPQHPNTLQLELADTTALAASEATDNAKIIPAAERMEIYLPMLKGKRVAVFANHTSLVGNTNLVDTLVKSGINVTVVFGPEHGFRGTADAGEIVGNYTDEKTGIPVVSLYGRKHKPAPEDLKNVDVMVFDIQDVGTRFYTYISSMEEYMVSAIENDKSLIILDRPNPNGFYVDGPVLDTNFRSFVGMQPVPIVYGLTIGEYAWYLVDKNKFSNKYMIGKRVFTKVKDTMINFSEISLITFPPGVIPMGDMDKYSTAKKLEITVIRCSGYTHKSKYRLPVNPSPNLKDISAIYWYPSTCLFEGTALSEGRGTDKPFEYIGHPSLPKTFFSFTPVSTAGAKNPKLKDRLCYGWDLSGSPQATLKRVNNQVQLKFLLQAYRLFPEKDSFFRSSFSRLAGTDVLMKQIKDGVSEDSIRKSWEPALSNFKAIRKKYLLYEDF